jgi:hypothetical protein
MRLSLVLLVAVSCGARPAVYRVPAPVAKPPQIVVTIVVDQLASWMADARLPELPGGGFARLRREGTWVRQLRHAHATTDTAPGHASLYTGEPPRASGVWANERLDEAGERVPFLADPDTRPVTARGPQEGTSSSAARLAPTLADRLRAARPKATIVSVSLKDRAAIAGGGHNPDAVLWFDPKLDAFLTSSAFLGFPKWARGIEPAAYRGTPWTVTDEAWLRAHAAHADDQPGEGDLKGFGTTFPHRFEAAEDKGRAFRAGPQADDAVLALGLAAVKARRPGEPMLLALSLSAHDYVAHIFGPDSWESWESMRRLDTQLAQFFEALDREVGPAGWAVVLSADHGGISLPEAPAKVRPWCSPGAAPDPLERPCVAHRIDPDALAVDLKGLAARELEHADWVRGVSEPFVFLDAPPEELDRTAKVVSDYLRRQPGIADVIDMREVPKTCPPESDESTAALVCRSAPSDPHAVLYFVVTPGTFVDTLYVPGKGASHGTPYLYDRTVPLLVRAPGVVPAGRVLGGPVSHRVFSETAAALLGLAR